MKRKLLLGFIASILVLVISLFVWSHYERIWFENHFLEIMKQLNSSESRTEVGSWFDAEFNFTELYDWVNEKLVFVPRNETFERNTDPKKILESGKGRIEEFSILYVAACLAHGYQRRLVAAVNISNHACRNTGVSKYPPTNPPINAEIGIIAKKISAIWAHIL